MWLQSLASSLPLRRERWDQSLAENKYHMLCPEYNHTKSPARWHASKIGAASPEMGLKTQEEHIVQCTTWHQQAENIKGKNITKGQVQCNTPSGCSLLDSVPNEKTAISSGPPVFAHASCSPQGLTFCPAELSSMTLAILLSFFFYSIPCKWLAYISCVVPQSSSFRLLFKHSAWRFK